MTWFRVRVPQWGMEDDVQAPNAAEAAVRFVEINDDNFSDDESPAVYVLVANGWREFVVTREIGDYVALDVA